MAKPTFSCSYEDLTNVARQAWFLCDNVYTRFIAYRPSKYTQAYLDENFVSISNFFEMDEHSDYAEAVAATRASYLKEILGIENFFKFLKNYAKDIYQEKDKRDNLYKDAGQQLYDKLHANNWEDYDGLLKAMIRFAQTRKVELLARDMPADFVAQLEAKKAKLLATYQAWLDKDTEARAAGEAKVMAGNTIKANMFDMFADAQLVFIDDKVMAKKFGWGTVLAQVQATKEAGVGGKIIDILSKKVVKNVTVTILALNMSVVNNAKGRYGFSPVPEGTYDIEIKAEGYKTQVIKGCVIQAGVTKRLNIELEAVI